MAKRISTLTKVANLFGTGKDGFGPGNPPGTAATRLDEDWFNHAQEEVAAIVERAGGTLDDDNRHQVAQILSLRPAIAMLSRPWRQENPFSAASAINAVACSDSRTTDIENNGSTFSLAIAVAGVNCFALSYNRGSAWGSDLEGGTATYNAVAFKDPTFTDAVVAMAVGESGVWRRHQNDAASGAANSNGAISGTPQLTGLFWDPGVNGGSATARWWAFGPGGIYRTQDASISWLQISADAYTCGNWMRNADGTTRKVFYSSTNNRFDYVDGIATSVTAGVAHAAGASGQGVRDPAMGGVLFYSGSTSELVGTDGVSLIGEVDVGTEVAVIKLAGCVLLITNPGNDKTRLAVYSKKQGFDFDTANLAACPIHSDTFKADAPGDWLGDPSRISFCDSFVVCENTGAGSQDEIWISEYLPRLF